MSRRYVQVGNKQFRVDAIDSVFDAYHPYLHLTLSNYESAFIQELDRCSVFNGYNVVIRTLNVPPVQATPVQLSQGDFFAVCNKVNQLLASGHLSYSSSTWSANPFLFINQTTGAQELGINYCSLNNITVDEEGYRVPTCEEVLNSIGYSECFSLIVLKDGFKQLALDEHSKQKTAFMIPGLQGKFEWNVLSSSLKNAQVHLQRAVDYCLGGLDPNQYKVYLGQILVHTADVNQHLNLLAVILNRLVSCNLRLDLNQCIFMCSSLSFLGMELSKAGLLIGAEKVERIAQFPQPNNRTELQSFLGLVGQYRRYVDDYDSLVKPLIGLVSRNELYCNLNAKERWSFSELKSRFQDAKPIPLKNPHLNNAQLNNPQYANNAAMFYTQ